MDKQTAEAEAGKVQVVEAESFEARLMKVPEGAGAKKFTPFQLDRHKRFNAHGCL